MNIIKIKEKANMILEKRNSECSYIEYKKSGDQLDKILKTICAYGNNYYLNNEQYIFIGVEEENSDFIKAIPKLPIVGIEESKLEIISNKIKALRSYLSPNVNFEVITNKYCGKFYILVVVLKQDGGPFSTIEKDKKIGLKPGRYIRTDFESRIATITEEFELIKKFANYSFEEQINNDASIDDLSFDYMQEYMSVTSHRLISSSLSKHDISIALNLVDKNDPNIINITNYAILMFSKNPERFIKNAYVELIIDEFDNKKLMESKTFKGPIWKQYFNVLEFIKNNYLNTLTIREDNVAKNRLVANYPFTALEELLANAIVHNDYQNYKNIQIYITNKYINIVNYNSPLPPIDICGLNNRTYFNERNFINPNIRDMFKQLHIIESFGTGIGEAKKAMKDNCSPQLYYKEFSVPSQITSVVIPVNEEYNQIKLGINPHKNIGFEEQIYNVILNSKLSTLKKRNIINIYNKVKDDVFGNADIREILNCSETNATTYLKLIEELNIVKVVIGKGKGKYKFLI